MLIGHRLFYALLPPEVQAEQIDALRRSLGRGTSVEKEHLHATLWVSHDFQNFPHDLAKRMLAVGTTVEAERFIVTLTQVSRSRGHVVLQPEQPSRAARQLANQLRGKMKLLGVDSPRKRFNLHFTLLYAGRTPFAPSSLEIGPIHWCAENFVLIHSVVGRHEHHELGRWSLHLPRQFEFSFD